MRQRNVQNRRDSTPIFLNIYSPGLRRCLTLRPICGVKLKGLLLGDELKASGSRVDLVRFFSLFATPPGIFSFCLLLFSLRGGTRELICLSL